MRKPVKYITLATVAFFIFTAVAYACPGITYAAGSALNFSSAMPEHDMGKDDCGDHKINICQSVRDQLVSIKAPTVQPASTLYRVSLTPQPLLFEAATAPHLFYGRSPPEAPAFHPVFKLQLAYSYLVLRL
jgi:hypothetical protein